MSDLIELTTAKGRHPIFINPDMVSVIQRYHKDMDLGEYSELTMQDGTRIQVCGLPTQVAKTIRDAKHIQELTK